jgi:hypothetical protein
LESDLDYFDNNLEATRVFFEGGLEKFAELIVKECAQIVEASTWNLPHGYKAVDQANLVKKHFGVEE